MPILFSIDRKGGKFYCSADGGAPFLVGVQASWHGRLGIQNDNSPIAKSCKFAAADYRGTYGFWADFIFPTSVVESDSSFLVINTYDSAFFTFGFPQFSAGDANGDFVRYFRAMLGRAQAHDYFPGLSVKNGHIHAAEASGDVQLEDDKSSEPLQRYLNPTAGHVEDDEIIAAAKFIHWTMNDAGARELQVHFMVEFFRSYLHTADQHGLADGLSAALCCVICDIRHQGRVTGLWPLVAGALKATDPFLALLALGAEDYQPRVKELRKLIMANPDFAKLHWSSAKSDFI